MVVAEWIGDVTERLSLAACRRLPLAGKPVQYTGSTSVIQFALLLPLSSTFSCPFISRPSSTSILTTIDSGPTFHVPLGNCLSSLRH
jgi:hypothetical protein